MKTLHKNETTTVAGAHFSDQYGSAIINSAGFQGQCIESYNNLLKEVILETEAINFAQIEDFANLKKIFKDHKEKMSPACLADLDIFMTYAIMDYSV